MIYLDNFYYETGSLLHDLQTKLWGILSHLALFLRSETTEALINRGKFIICTKSVSAIWDIKVTITYVYCFSVIYADFDGFKCIDFQ